jgi:glycosyltransferase involved in cell wall biosynthesis
LAPVLTDPQIRFIPCAPGGDWGHTERNFATPLARGQYIAHIDDDDVYAPGAKELMVDAISKADGRPIIFRMQFPNGITLWQDPNIRCGNVGTPMMLMPNRPTMFGKWEPYVGGDCAFLQSCKWKAEDYIWRPEVIALLGHNI